MAIINTYPSATPKGADLLIGTQVKDATIEENSTKSFTVDALGSYILTSNNVITGSGTLNTVAMFTPNGQAIGDSLITQASLGQAISVATNLLVSDDLTVTGDIETNSSLTVTGNTNFLSTITAGGGTGTAGQVLSSTGTGVEWVDNTTTGTVTGTGTTNTIPIWTDGPNGVLGDSIITYDDTSVPIITIGPSPSRLEVDGDLTVNSRASFTGTYARFNTQVQDGTNSPGTSGQLLTSTASGVEWVDPQNVLSPYIISEKIIVSTAELKDLHNTPKILVDVTAGNPKEICQVYSVVFSVGGQTVTNNLTFPGDVKIQSDNANAWEYTIPQATANAEFIPFYVPSLTAGDSGLDSDVVLTSAGAAVETGTATTTMTVWITYRIFEINA